jgi:hypothetical protein
MFRFGIRDVLWLTVVVALGVAWAIDHWRLTNSRDAWMTSAKELRPYANAGPWSFTIDESGVLTRWGD